MLTFIKDFFRSTPPSIDADRFIWKYMDLDTELVEEIKSIYLKNLPKDLNNLNFFNVLPITINVPDILGSKVTCCSLIYKAGNETQKYAHKDPILHSTLALNIPLINCENSVTTLYKDDKHSLHISHRDQLIQILPVDKGTVLSTYVLDRPILFNTRIFHNVENFSTEPRVAISLRFKKNPLDWIQ